MRLSRAGGCLAALVLLSGRATGDDDGEGDDGEEAEGFSEGDFDSVDDEYRGRTPKNAPGGFKGGTTVFVIQHGFLSEEKESPTWLPRGTLLLSGAPGSVEARLSDAKEFVELRSELQGTMAKESEKGSYYAIRMYRDQNPSRVLLASVPAKLLADHFEDWHDILRVSVGPQGLPVALSYRVRHTLGLSLFDHTQVHLSESTASEGPRVPPRQPQKEGLGGTGEGGEPQSQSIIRKYWWVIMIAVLLTMSGGGGDSPGGGGGGGTAAARPARRGS